MSKHLLHIGYPKTGSSFLQDWFQQHPQLLYKHGGMGGFHNVYQVSHTAVQDAANAIKYYVTSDESLSTPKASAGTIPINGTIPPSIPSLEKENQKKVCAILKDYYPGSKVLFVTRGFTGLIMSSYSQMVRTGFIMSLPQFLEHNRLTSHVGGDDSDDEGELDYTFIANIYEEAFGKENVIILPYELLRDDQNKFLSLIEERLGLTHYDININKVNESLSKTELYWYPRMSAFVSKTSKRLGNSMHHKIFSWYTKKVFYNGFRRVIQVIDRIKPGHTIQASDLPEEVQIYYRRKNKTKCAAKLKDNPVYSPYISDYLLD